MTAALQFTTGADTATPDHAPVRVLVGGASQLRLLSGDHRGDDDGTLHFDLPPLTPGAQHAVPVHMEFPSRHVCTVARQPYEPEETHAWKYEVL